MKSVIGNIELFCCRIVLKKLLKVCKIKGLTSIYFLNPKKSNTFVNITKENLNLFNIIVVFLQSNL